MRRGSATRSGTASPEFMTGPRPGAREPHSHARVGARAARAAHGPRPTGHEPARGRGGGRESEMPSRDPRSGGPGRLRDLRGRRRPGRALGVMQASSSSELLRFAMPMDLSSEMCLLQAIRIKIRPCRRDESGDAPESQGPNIHCFVTASPHARGCKTPGSDQGVRALPATTGTESPKQGCGWIKALKPMLLVVRPPFCSCFLFRQRQTLG
jgi:hypothetical protein